jgi:hypothetical protein
MPTQNPRLTITLSPPLDAAVRRLSELTGQSKSSLIVELLDQARPVLERMAEVITVAKTATEDAKARMRSNLDEAQSKLEEHLGLVNDLWDQQTADLLGEVEQVQRRRRKGTSSTATDGREDGGRGRAGASRRHVEKPAQPPHVTRGSGTPVTTPKQKGKSAAKPAPARVGRKNG